MHSWLNQPCIQLSIEDLLYAHALWWELGMKENRPQAPVLSEVTVGGREEARCSEWGA